MLDKVNLNKKLSKEDYTEEAETLKLRLGELQREVKSTGIPVIILFEGWDASGISNICNKVIHSIDPRGYDLYTGGKPAPYEKKMPLLWRFWLKIPQKGHISIFDRSWYSRIIYENINDAKKCRKSINYAGIFERQLHDDGYLIIKLFVHISKKEQKKRFRKSDSDPCLKYYLKKTDWNPNDDYDRFYPYINDMLNQTDFDYSGWNIIEADDIRYATIKAYGLIIRQIEAYLSSHNTSDQYFEQIESSYCPKKFMLPDANPENPLQKSEYLKIKEKYGKKIPRLQAELYKKKIPLIILFEGWDASGKGGAIVRLTNYLNPRGYRIIPVAAPSDFDLLYNYQWRFYKDLPKPGGIRIFDRSWYGRVLVERVEGFCNDYEWQRAYHEINEFEAQIIDWGGIILKFWMHIDKKEQLKRFEQRQYNPFKQWKITEEDWRNRAKWDLYEDAVSDMVRLTSTDHCPWNIVLGNNKYNARVQVLSTVADTLEMQLAERKK